ncbi:hypothetical protein C5S35_15945 [Candidatus Methanophagaceae archaeon]|jgi:hypothetical protein|nr:hypothetical protein C5S35_15945 [Methanophagales archaeon]
MTFFQSLYSTVNTPVALTKQTSLEPALILLKEQITFPSLSLTETLVKSCLASIIMTFSVSSHLAQNGGISAFHGFSV